MKKSKKKGIKRVKPKLRIPPGFPKKPTLSDYEDFDRTVYWGNGP